MTNDSMTRCILHGGQRRVAWGCVGHTPDPEVPFPMSVRRQVYAVVMYDEETKEWTVETEFQLNSSDSLVWCETDWDDGSSDAGWDAYDDNEDLIEEVYADLGARLARPMFWRDGEGEKDA